MSTNATNAPRIAAERAMELAQTQNGRSLAAISRERPALVVFLRHSGCTFCREALADLAKRRSAIEGGPRGGAQIVLVHMGDDASAAKFFGEYGLGDVARISDPERKLYRAFELRRGSFWQLFGPRVIMRGLMAAIRGGHGVGRVQGDPFQMPGAFLVQNGRIVSAFRHAAASDRPEYESIACALPTTQA